MDFFEPDDISMLSMSVGHCLLVTTTKKRGKVFGWGCNLQKQLSIDANPTQLGPIEILQEFAVLMVACGYDFSMCLTVEKNVYAWGSNGHGQINQQTKIAKFPKPQMIILGYEVEKIACSAWTGFAWNEGNFFSWGSNRDGEHGTGDTFVNGCTRHRGMNVAELVCGMSFVLMLDTDYKLWCWGDNLFGQLGLVNSPTTGVKPQEIPFFKHEEIHSFACGGYHSLVWTSKGLFVCGSNETGPLGFGTGCDEKRIRLFKELTFFRGKRILSIGTGAYHSFCMTDEGLYRWGDNSWGQLLHNENKIYTPELFPFLTKNE